MYYDTPNKTTILEESSPAITAHLEIEMQCIQVSHWVDWDRITLDTPPARIKLQIRIFLFCKLYEWPIRAKIKRQPAHSGTLKGREGNQV
jgi:hypothetical protein